MIFPTYTWNLGILSATVFITEPLDSYIFVCRFVSQDLSSISDVVSHCVYPFVFQVVWHFDSQLVSHAVLPCLVLYLSLSPSLLPFCFLQVPPHRPPCLPHCPAPNLPACLPLYLPLCFTLCFPPSFSTLSSTLSTTVSSTLSL